MGLLVFPLFKLLGIVEKGGDSVSVEDPSFECIDSLDGQLQPGKKEEEIYP